MAQIKNISIGGMKMTVEKKRIKNMYIRVAPPEGAVKITAPVIVSDAAVRDFALSRIDWIKGRKMKIREHSRRIQHLYVSGETHYLWGKPYRLQLSFSEKEKSVRTEGDSVILQTPADSTYAQRAAAMDGWYRQELKDAVPQILKKAEKRTGCRAAECRVKNMKTRWGSCNTARHRIWLSLQLAKKPPECLEYVMVHELVHLYEKNHDKTFYTYMDRFYPGWRDVKKLLNSPAELPSSDNDLSPSSL